MKRRTAQAAAASVLALLLTTALAPAQALEVGQAAPAFELPGTAGATVRSELLKGKVVYLDFWASWCGPCKQSFPWMSQLQRKYGPQGFAVVAVNVDARLSDAEEFLRTAAPEFTIAFDSKGQTPRQYQVKGMPYSVLIDRDGRILGQHAGFRTGETAALETHIQQALNKGAAR